MGIAASSPNTYFNPIMNNSFEYKWVSCGSADSRMELFGKTIVPTPDSPDSLSELVAISAIRLSNYQDSVDEDEAAINQIDLEEIELEFPILYQKDNLEVVSLTSDTLILEGFEGPDNRFMDMIDVAGWKLVLTQIGDEISFEWFLLSDWQIDAHPDYFPGDTVGEISIIGSFGGVEESDVSVEIPWPMSADGRLSVGVPERKGGKWKAPVDPRKILSVFDGAGALLKDFPFGSLHLSAIKDVVEEFIGEHEDFIHLETGIDAFGRIFFDVVIGPPDEIDIAEFGGLKLALVGDASIILSSVFEDDHIELSLKLFLSNNAGLKLHGPFIRKIEGALDEAKEIMAMLPIEGIGVPELPDLEISFQLGLEPLDITMASANLPLRWDFIPGLNPVSNFLSGIPLNIDPSQLAGFKFGSLDGDAPQVEMIIEKAEFYHQEDVYGIDFEIKLNIKIDAGDPIPFIADWRFTLDTDTMAFDPAASLKIRTEYKEFTVAGLTVTGLDTLMVSFEGGNLSLTASKLKAFYGGISEGDDGGFEMEVSNLLIDGGGLDMELFLKGGVTKVSGIGESFKGAEGQVIFSRSKFQSGYIKAEGPLPWMDNATGSITLSFKEGFKLDRVQADFQLGIHQKTDWWVELELKSVNIDIHLVNNKPNLILMVTGKISITPPAGSGGFILSHLKSANLEFKDLVLTKSFDTLPPGIALSVVLAEPKKVDLLGVFGFEMRSIGIGSGFGEGQAAITIGGQVFFSSNNLQNKDPEFHKFKIGKPKLNELIPQIAFENLALDFSYKPSLKIVGSVEYKDTPEWKGFKGQGQLTINKTVNINVILEFATVLRESDEKKLRVWMVYAEWRDLDIKFIDEFYLRDLGIGFGWRKTLQVMDNPNIILDNASKGTMTIGPHLPSSWADDLEGDKARWTVVMSAWMTYGLKKRTEPTPLVGDILFGLRSDLTILISMRGWIFGVLDELKKGSGGLKPSIIGLMYYSARNKHLLATYVVDPSATSPKGVPPALVNALIKSPFSFVLETKPNLFRLELGWPRQLSFPLGVYTGKVGFLMRSTSTSLTVGIGFEIAIDHAYNFGFSIGIGSIGINIKIYIGVYGMILARIGNKPALYGIVGINALILIDIHLSVNFKIAWIRIKFSIGVSLTIVLSARVDFGISDAGFGVEGYASASLRIWKFSFGAQVSFAMNKSALYEARDRVFEGVTMAGNDTEKEVRFLPEPLYLLPPVKEQAPKWRAMAVRKGEYIYLLLLPEEDSWFACPAANINNGATENTIDPYLESNEASYKITFELNNVEFENTAQDIEKVTSGNTSTVKHRVPWNTEVKIDGGEDTDQSFKLGNLYYETAEVQSEHQLIDQLLEDASLQPQLIIDWRVRTEEGAKDGMGDDLELRPDVRSPKFSADDSLYDLALEEAFKYELDDIFSWRALTIAQTRWTEEVINKPEVMEFMLGEDYNLPEVDVNDEKSVYKRRKILLNGLENMSSIRGGLTGTLLREYKIFINSDTPLEELEVLNTSGLAYKFKISNEEKFSLKVNSIKIDQGYGKFQTVETSRIENGNIDHENFGIGFEKEGLQYRLRDLLEFQDQEGIHFSWELESDEEEEGVKLMTEKEASGLQEENKYFEYFDHYLVERENLSSESQETGYTKWEAKPGFVPALVDIGDGNRNFYLVVPRFDFSDMFQVPVAIGDQLLYRFTAVDVFGNHSQTLEYLTTKKHLDAPPPPDKAVCAYEIELLENSIDYEQLTIPITKSKEMANWEGSIVRYEIWAKSQSLSSGGYFGLGDDVEEEGGSDDNPVISPKGMQFIGTVNNPDVPFEVADPSNFNYGQVYTFYVRSISKEGNASRLIRCEHATAINKQKSKPYAYLERIPPISNEVVEWVNHIDLRGEVTPYLEPVLVNYSHQFSLKPTSEILKREVSIKLLHSNYVDEKFHYPTGGYEVYVRDRDASTGDDIKNYQQQVSVEVLSPAIYGISPYNTNDFSKWSSNFRGEVAQLDDIPIEGFLSWGEELMMSGTERIKGFSDGLLIHARLEDLLYDLQKWTENNNGKIIVHGGGVSPKEYDQISFDDLATNFDLEKDSFGMGFLGWMGRTVDIAIYQNGEILRDNTLIDLIGDFFSLNEDYNLTLELLLNSDRQTPMNYYRLGLHPVVKALSMAEDPEQQEVERISQLTGSFDTFKSILQYMLGQEKILSGFEQDEILDRYVNLTDRFVQSRSITDLLKISLSVSWYNEQADIERMVNTDDTISFQQTYEEPLARRFAYRVQRIGRYYPLYKQLGLISPAFDDLNESPVLIRLPRVEHPRVPTVEFLGNKLRDDIQCTEWLIREHEEEALVQSNETLRNRLGYRSLAWSLHSEVKNGWRQWSGWSGSDDWLTHEFDEQEDVIALTDKDINTLKSDAKWTGDSSLKPDASLKGHPFTELLEPKGMVIRVPELPFYYQYRLAAFVRADDIDSQVKLTDRVGSLPSVIPYVSIENSGWTFVEDKQINIWWKIPSVWESFTKIQTKIWKNEEPFAKRLWDFDLKYTIQIRRQGVIMPLLYIQAEAVDQKNLPDLRKYIVTTAGSYLFHEKDGKVEKLAPISLKSRFDPELKLSLNVNEKLVRWMSVENDFVFEIICTRSYGHNRVSKSKITIKTPIEV